MIKLANALVVTRVLIKLVHAHRYAVMAKDMNCPAMTGILLMEMVAHLHVQLKLILVVILRSNLQCVSISSHTLLLLSLC